MKRLILSVISLIAPLMLIASGSDTIKSGFSSPLEWRIGIEAAAAYVPATNGFLRGNNLSMKSIRNDFSGAFKADFSFDGHSREGMLYKGLYQGIGAGVTSFSTTSLLGTPVSVYVYQGSPIVHFSDKFWLGYEWKFGGAFGWKHYEKDADEYNSVVSTSVTAHMALGLRLSYSLTDRWQLSFGVDATHFSNGNTSWPNAGINSVGASVGVSYLINPQQECELMAQGLEEEADKGRWLYDVMVYAAWRKRVVNVGNPPEPQLCPGKFGVAGLQFSPLRRLNRWIAVGPALDLQWDESAGISSYWVDGTRDDYLKFERPPFSKQISIGLSAHAELTMPIFTINAGLGYDILNPEGNKRFYQSLTLKTFITEKLYLNVGYRLGNFKDPQNLMLGIGVRI